MSLIKSVGILLILLVTPTVWAHDFPFLRDCKRNFHPNNELISILNINLRNKILDANSKEEISSRMRDFLQSEFSLADVPAVEQLVKFNSLLGVLDSYFYTILNSSNGPYLNAEPVPVNLEILLAKLAEYLTEKKSKNILLPYNTLNSISLNLKELSREGNPFREREVKKIGPELLSKVSEILSQYQELLEWHSLVTLYVNPLTLEIFQASLLFRNVNLFHRYGSDLNAILLKNNIQDESVLKEIEIYLLRCVRETSNEVKEKTLLTLIDAKISFYQKSNISFSIELFSKEEAIRYIKLLAKDDGHFFSWYSYWEDLSTPDFDQAMIRLVHFHYLHDIKQAKNKEAIRERNRLEHFLIGDDE